MNNLVFGVATVLVSGVIFFLSWKAQSRGQFRLAVGLLLLGGLLLRIYLATDLYLHDWDERYHALVAKNMLTHPFRPMLYARPVLPYDYRNWTSSHIWLHKQPLPLWMMALSLKLFGVHEFALRLPSIVLSTLCIGLVYAIGKALFERPTGYWTAGLMAINGLVLELTAGRVATDHIDVAFLFFVTLSVWLVIRFSQSRRVVYNLLAGASLGAAILCKWLPALVVAPMWLLLVPSGTFKSRWMPGHWLAFLAMATLVFMPWQLYIFKVFPVEARWESQFNLRHFTEVLEGNGQPFYYFINQIRINYGELIYVPVIWFLIQFRKSQKLWAVTLWFWGPFLVFSIAQTKMQGYLLFTCPALFLMTAAFSQWLIANRTRFRYRWLVRLVLLALFVLPIRYSLERLKPFENMDRNPPWAVGLRQLNQQVPQGVLLNYKRPVEAMFYTHLMAYESLPEAVVVDSLQRHGFRILIHDSGSLPEWTRKQPGVQLIRLPEE